MNELAARFGSRADFLTVYVHEAHTEGGWQAPDQPNRVKQASSSEERLEAARGFYNRYKVMGQLAVDGIDNHATLFFSPLPDRIFVLDANARFVYVQGPGPYDYQPDELASFLEATLS